MESTNFDILTQHILHIYDLNGNEIKFDNLEIKEVKRQYSSVISPTLFVDGNPIKSKTHRVTYQCRCGKTPNILLVKYLVKPSIVCYSCLQNPKFEDRIIPNPLGKGKKPEERKIEEKPKNSQLCFDTEDDDFKERYKENHITNEEMIEWWPYLYRVAGMRPIEDNVSYFYAVPNNNQSKYSSMVSKDDGETLEPLSIELKCSMCGKIFKIHNQNLRNKNKEKILCSSCSLCNTTFPIKMYKDTGITYQSNAELEFIEMCIDNGIEIQNGFEIPYKRNGRSHIYFSDFYLPSFKTIVEIKGNNVYYRMEVKSGKFQSKCQGAEIFAKENNLRYEVVFAENVKEFVSKLLDERDSLNNSESC